MNNRNPFPVWQFWMVIPVCLLLSWLTARLNAQLNDARSRTDGTVFLVDGRPTFIRLIQHQGESFADLRAIGFNAVQLPVCATDEQLKEARASGIWLVCPPPSSVGLDSISSRFDPVIAWSVAERSSARHAQLIRESIQEIRASDARKSRPVVTGISSHFKMIAELVDIPIVGKLATGTSFKSRDYGDWISARTRSLAKPCWVDIPSTLPDSLRRQARAMGFSPVPLPVQHQQLRFLLFESIVGGGRGIRLLSRSRLDAADAETRIRVASLRWLNNQIKQMEPWIAGGLVESLPVRTTGEWLCQARLPDSRLVLANRSTGWEQWIAGDLPLNSLACPDLNISNSESIYQIDERGANVTAGQRNATGRHLKFEPFASTAAVLITDSPAPPVLINQETQNLLQDRMTLTQQSLAWAQLVQQKQDSLGPTNSADSGVLIQDAIQDVRLAEQMLAAGNSEFALEKLKMADSRSATARRLWLQSRRELNNGVIVSPLLMHPGLIPDHDTFTARLVGRNWSPNGLAAGDFENLQHMLDSGWRNRREDIPEVSTQVTLDKSALVEGRYGLKMVARSNLELNPVPAPPVWIQSSGVAVQANQLVRIHGFVRVPEKIIGSHDGLMIIDSLGGSELATRIQASEGWREFTIYRTAYRNSDVQVTFVLTGLGTAMVDEVTIRTLDVVSDEVQARQPDASIK